jgi:hypothetical protein
MSPCGQGGLGGIGANLSAYLEFAACEDDCAELFWSASWCVEEVFSQGVVLLKPKVDGKGSEDGIAHAIEQDALYAP